MAVPKHVVCSYVPPPSPLKTLCFIDIMPENYDHYIIRIYMVRPSNRPSVLRVLRDRKEELDFVEKKPRIEIRYTRNKMFP
jgi:hypothetical protein